MIDNSKEYILCSAIKRVKENFANPYRDGCNDICKVELGYRHHDIIQRCPLEILDVNEQGFFTSKGRFVNRSESMKIAYDAGQVDAVTAFGDNKEGMYKPLFSEDLY